MVIIINIPKNHYQNNEDMSSVVVLICHI